MKKEDLLTVKRETKTQTKKRDLLLISCERGESLALGMAHEMEASIGGGKKNEQIHVVK
jgi:hypothetical protein